MTFSARLQIPRCCKSRADEDGVGKPGIPVHAEQTAPASPRFARGTCGTALHDPRFACNSLRSAAAALRLGPAALRSALTAMRLGPRSIVTLTAHSGIRADNLAAQGRKPPDAAAQASDGGAVKSDAAAHSCDGCRSFSEVVRSFAAGRAQ